MDAVRTSITVAVRPTEAFTLFTARAGEWWPRAFTWSQQTLVDLVFEPRPGGACYEVGPHGFRCDFGRMLEVVPGERLVFTWQIDMSRAPQPDDQKASLVTVRFIPESIEQATRVEVAHDGFERHGEGSERYRDGMVEGWRVILEAFARKAAAAK